MSPGEAHFWSKGHNLKKKLARGLLDDASYKTIKALGLVVSDYKIYSCFPHISQCKPVTPSRSIVGPRDII